MALSTTSKNQVAALVALLADPAVQTELRDAANRLGQPNALPLLAQGHGNHLTSGGKSTVSTAISTLSADIAGN